MSVGRIGQRNALSVGWRAVGSIDFIFTIKLVYKNNIIMTQWNPLQYVEMTKKRK